MLKNLYAASVPAKAANVPSTAWVTMPSPNWESKSLLSAPSAMPSATAKAITSAGLMTRLNELTNDSAKAPSEPIVTAAISGPRFASVVSMSGVMIQVTAAAATTRNRLIAVFWTTESIVIGPPVVTGACTPGWPGSPVPQVEGSV
jgi:hypothetical protein